MSKPRDGVWSILLHLDYVLQTRSVHSMKGVTLFIKSWRAQLSGCLPKIFLIFFSSSWWCNLTLKFLI